jgi:hypothetical protein
LMRFLGGILINQVVEWVVNTVSRCKAYWSICKAYA